MIITIYDNYVKTEAIPNFQTPLEVLIAPFM